VTVKGTLTGPQRAAMLLVQLGKDRSAKVLRGLSDSEVEELMAEVSMLEAPDPDAMEQVLLDFLEQAATRVAFGTGGVEFARAVLEESVGAQRAAEILGRLSATRGDRPFAFLRQVDPRQTVTFLQDEHPQTIALVLANMVPEQAALVLGGLTDDLQGAVAYRIATMDRTSPEMVRKIEAVLERKLSTLLNGSSTSATGGVQPLIEILNRSERTTERLILEGLEEVDQELAEEIRSKMFMFEDITGLDDRAIQLILREVNLKDLAVALKGVRRDVREKILTNMSERAAANLNEEIELLGPTRLKSVEDAQMNIVRAIRSLEEAGQIVISRGGDEFVV
jgi:flagellar motor switch protein FliG